VTSFDKAVSSYTPPTTPPAPPAPAQITFTDEYEEKKRLRMQIVAWNHEHPAIDLAKINEAFSSLQQASDRAAAAMRFLHYELEIISQLEDLAHAAFVGPDDDATEEDMVYSDQYDDADTDPDPDTDTGEYE